MLDNGDQKLLPPNIQSVPAMLLVNDNYKVILGDEIIQHFEPTMKNKIANGVIKLLLSKFDSLYPKEND